MKSSTPQETSPTTAPRIRTAGAAARCSNPPAHESRIEYRDLPAATKAQVDRVRAAWEHKYPTAADATKAGWSKSTPNLFGIGAHYVHGVTGFLSVAEPFDAMHPNILLYDGEGPDAKFAGLSYIVDGNVNGFTGCYDYFHSHPSVCIDNERRITLTEKSSWRWYSEAECRAHRYQVLKLPGDEMLHLWIGPGYTKAPIFAHDNPKIYDGYYPKRGA